MAHNMPEPPPRLRQSVYWRRRTAVLTLGTGLVSVLVWSVTGVLGGAGHAAGAARPGAAATARPAAATGGATPEGARSPAPRARSTAPRARAPGQAAGGPSAGRSGTPGTAAAAGQVHPPAGLPPACPPRDVVLSLVASQGSYGPAAAPQFQVFVVSVGARDCSVNIGPAALSVLIRAGGTARVWDSADCAQTAGPRFVQLGRGVPRVLHFRWDRQASSPGCQQAGGHARPGTYTATAVAPAARLASQGTVFVLTAPGVGMP